MRGILYGAASAVVIAGVLAGTVHAQDASSSSEAVTVIDATNGVANYGAAFFIAYSPVTALDMVQRVPGFSLNAGDTSRRGLGDSFGNLLINGQRPANKSQTLEVALQRIRAGDVERIELIQEAQPDYDMRGHARLVNVITREGTGNSGSWNGRLEMTSSGRIGPQGEVSYTTNTGGLEMTFGLYGHVYGRKIHRRYAVADAAGNPIEFQQDHDQRNWEVLRPSVALNWQINDSSSLRVDAQTERWEWRRRQFNFVYGPDGLGGTLTGLEEGNTNNSGNIHSASATYNRDLTDTLSSQTILLVTREDWTDAPAPFATYDPVTGFRGATIVEAQGEYEETALRQTLSWNPSDRHALEFGAETAINVRDAGLALSSDDGTTVTPIDLPVANTRVEENRTELFASHVWTINSALSLETGLRYESSEIIQTGDANQTRTFNYAKPNFTLNWRQDDQNRIRFTARRDVAQLQFGKFASNVDVSDNNQTVGNPDYVPQRSWIVEAEWERRFGDDGSLSVQLRHDWVQDLDGWIPVTTSTGVFDAPGNIGDGTMLRADIVLSMPLDGFGLSNATLDADLSLRDTKVDDPLTGEESAWPGMRPWRFIIDYTQSFPEQGVSWGMNYRIAADSETFRAQEFRTEGVSDGMLDAYVETTRWFGVTTRVGVETAFDNGADRERIFYDGSRANGLIDRVEQRNQNRHPIWYLQLRGTF